MSKLIRRCFIPIVFLCLAYGTVVADSPAPATEPAATMPTSAPATITWDQAKDHIGEDAVVTGPVVGSHDFGGAAVLNVGKDHPDPTRFTVYIGADKRSGIPDDLYEGKTISVSGTLKIFHKVAEIEADAAHITVIDQSTTAPASQP